MSAKRGASSTRKMVPPPPGPPCAVVPYRFPSGPSVSDAAGFAPFVPWNKNKDVNTPLVVMAKTEPDPTPDELLTGSPPKLVVPYSRESLANVRRKDGSSPFVPRKW